MVDHDLYNNSIKMSKKHSFLLPLFLLATATCLQTYSYTYNQNSTLADSNSKVILFGLTAGQTITFDIVFAPDTGHAPTSYNWNISRIDGGLSSGQSASIPVGLIAQHTLIVSQSADYMAWL